MLYVNKQRKSETGTECGIAGVVDGMCGCVSDGIGSNGCGDGAATDYNGFTNSGASAGSGCVDCERLSAGLCNCDAVDGPCFGYVRASACLPDLPGHFCFWFAFLRACTHTGQCRRPFVLTELWAECRFSWAVLVFGG